MLSRSAWVADGWEVRLIPALVSAHVTNCYWTCFSLIVPWKTYLKALWKKKIKKKSTVWVLGIEQVSVTEGLGELDVVGSAWKLAAPHLFTPLCWHCFPEREVGLIYWRAGKLTGILTANEHMPQSNFLSFSNFMISWLPLCWENPGFLPNICHLLFLPQNAGEGRKAILARMEK